MRSRPFAFLPLLVSGICAVMLIRMARDDARFYVPLVAILVTSLLPAFLARRRMRRVLMSGDVPRILGSWQQSIERVMYPETMAPLMMATAYASYGWTDAARNALERAVRGPAWEAAREQRLFVEALLDTFEGNNDDAMTKASELLRLPLPSTGPFVRRRVTRLRQGVAAMVRAFSHASDAKDERRLAGAAKASPLVHWAMRYAQAIVAIDQGKKEDALALLRGAPEWPKESAFRAFHDELRMHLEGPVRT